MKTGHNRNEISEYLRRLCVLRVCAVHPVPVFRSED